MEADVEWVFGSQVGGGEGSQSNGRSNKEPPLFCDGFVETKLIGMKRVQKRSEESSKFRNTISIFLRQVPIILGKPGTDLQTDVVSW